MLGAAISPSMKSYILLLYFVSTCSGFFPFSSSSDNAANNVCIYSRDTKQFEPTCFICPANVYPTALLTCVNGTTMPNNITYSSANCMQGNCKINYPTLAPPTPLDLQPLLDTLAKIFARTKRSFRENFLFKPVRQTLRQTGPSKSNYEILDEIETYASDMEPEVDYDV